MAGVSLDAVWKTGVKLPGVVQSTAYGSPALKVGGQLMACVPISKSAEPGSLMVRVDRNEQRQTLLTEAPELYYVTDHYLRLRCGVGATGAAEWGAAARSAGDGAPVCDKEG